MKTVELPLHAAALPREPILVTCDSRMGKTIQMQPGQVVFWRVYEGKRQILRNVDDRPLWIEFVKSEV